MIVALILALFVAVALTLVVPAVRGITPTPAAVPLRVPVEPQPTRRG